VLTSVKRKTAVLYPRIHDVTKKGFIVKVIVYEDEGFNAGDPVEVTVTKVTHVPEYINILKDWEKFKENGLYIETWTSEEGEDLRALRTNDDEDEQMFTIDDTPDLEGKLKRQNDFDDLVEALKAKGVKIYNTGDEGCII